MKKTIITLCLILLAVSLINFSSAEEESLTSGTRGITLDIARWSQQQGQVLEDVCNKLGSEVISCSVSAGKIVGDKSISSSSLLYVESRNEELGNNLGTFSYVTEIYQKYGKDSLSIDETIKLDNGDIEQGQISFPDSVDASKVINKDYPAAKVILKGTINYDDKIIALKTGDSYHRAKTGDDKIIPLGTVTIEPLAGTLNIDLSDEGYFHIFGVKTFFPTGPRLQIITINAFKITNSKGRFLNVQVTPITATEFSFVKEGTRLWLNGNGKFQVIETGTSADKGTTVQGTNSYDLSMGHIAKVYVDEEGRAFYDVETKEIDGETYVIKTRWQDIPTTVDTEKAGIDIVKTLDKGTIVINEEGKFFIPNEDYEGEEKTDNFVVAIYEYGVEQYENIKQSISGK
jgi:hypothetical protein